MLKTLLTALALMFGASAAHAAPEPQIDHDCPCLTATDCETPMPTETDAPNVTTAVHEPRIGYVTVAAGQLAEIDYATIDEGVRDVVRWLNEYGFPTTDSGDGTKDMACALDEPMVAITASPGDMVLVADRLRGMLDDIGIECVPVAAQPLPMPQIQASYDPTSGIATVVILNLRDEMLNDALAKTRERAARDVKAIASHLRLVVDPA